MEGTLVWGCKCASWCDLNFSSAKVCSAAIFETSFSYDKDIWIAATDYYVHSYIIVLFSIDGYSPINKFLSFIIKRPVRDAYLFSLKFD